MIERCEDCSCGRYNWFECEKEKRNFAELLWNKQADNYNKWDVLSLEEQIDFINRIRK